MRLLRWPLVAVTIIVGCSRQAAVTEPIVDSADAAADAGARCHDSQCLVPAGRFLMGSPHSEPWRGRYTEELHYVTLTHDVLYDQYETTQAEWVAAGFPNLAGTKRNSNGGRDCTEPSCPATMMTWLEAANFANWRSRNEGLPECFELIGCQGSVGVDYTCTGVESSSPSYYDCRGYRLPTMAEYQYAARAGTAGPFYSGPLSTDSNLCERIGHLMEVAWFCANSRNITHPVGLKEPNAFGLHDMLGNVAELAGSKPDVNTVGVGEETDPGSLLPPDGMFGFTGGCYFSEPYAMRVASQALWINVLSWERQLTMAQGLGFRLVRSISRDEAHAW